jgi:hypothetical protein
MGAVLHYLLVFIIWFEKITDINIMSILGVLHFCNFYCVNLTFFQCIF